MEGFCLLRLASRATFQLEEPSTVDCENHG
jgi:hypothetical protein